MLYGSVAKGMFAWPNLMKQIFVIIYSRKMCAKNREILTARVRVNHDGFALCVTHPLQKTQLLACYRAFLFIFGKQCL